MDNQYNKMTQLPVNKLIISLAIPTVISMLITSIYNLVDAYFVGKIGTSASGAVGIILVLQSVIQAFGFTFGHGSGSIISRKLGEQDKRSADKFASSAFFSALIVGALLSIIGLSVFTPMLKVLGSTKTILPFAKDYGFYILLAAPFMTSSCVLNNIMRYEGMATLAMIGLTTGGVLNMILDPLFMFTFKMGIGGAGLATAISQVISFLMLLFMFVSGKTNIHLSIKNASHSFKDYKSIFDNGVPSLIRQGLNSLSTMVLNNCAAVYGDAAIAAMSIVGRICMFIASIMIGIGQGLQPVAAFNHGAKKYDRVKGAYKFTLLFSECVMFVFASVIFLKAPDVVALFREDPRVVEIGTVALRLQCISIFVQPLSVCTNMTFQSIGESGKASFLATLRSGLCFLPIILILPRFIGVLGIESAQSIADVLTFAVSLPMTLKYFKKY